MFSSATRILVFALLALTAAQAGPLGFDDIDRIYRPDRVLNACESCGFVTTYDVWEPQPETVEILAILAFVMTLVVIGLVGVRFRVRESSAIPPWRKIRELESSGTVRRLESGSVRKRREH